MTSSEQAPTAHETGQVAKGAFINLIGNAGKLSHFAFDVIASRVLGQATYGYFSTTWLFMHLALIVCYFGAHRLVIDYVARHRDNDESEYYRAIVGCLVVSLFLSFWLVLAIHLWADTLAAFIDKPPVAEYLKIMSWSAPFYCMTTIFLTATRGIKIMALWVVVRNAIEPFSDLLLLVSVFLLFGSFAAPFYAKATSFTMGSAWAFLFFTRHFQWRRLLGVWPNAATWKKILTFGFPVMLADFLSIVILKVDIIALSILVGTSHVAVFQVVLNISNVMRNIPQAVDPILMPIVVEMRRRRNYDSLNHVYAVVMRISLFLAFGFFVMIVLFGDLLMGVYGSTYTVGFTALIITCFGIMLHTVSSTVEPALIMSGYPYLNLINNILFVVINLTLDFLLIPSHGLWGAAAVSVAASSTTALLQMVLLYRILRVRPLTWNYLWVVGFGLISMAVFGLFKEGLALAGWTHAVFEIVLFALFIIHYLWIGWKFVLTSEERQTLSTAIGRNTQE